MAAALLSPAAHAQAPPELWHGQERTLRYRPDGADFVITNGTHRFTRALYGTNTAFRVEAGDLPEFALYLPGMGGNLKFGLLAADGQSKWLPKATRIAARYRPGAMRYEVTDPLLGSATLRLDVLARAEAEGIVVKAWFDGAPAGLKLIWAFGGATGKKFSRDGDIGADPESSFDLKPDYCRGNVFALSKNTFTLRFGADARPAKPGAAPAEPKQLTGIVPVSSTLHVADAGRQESPRQLWESGVSETPVLTGAVPVKAGEALYFAIQKPETGPVPRYADVARLFDQAEAARQTLANRVQVRTPDPYLNTLGGALSVAADAIWESPSYLHGSVAWRMRLNGWRGAYAADALSWHDRARSHFRAYAQSQLTAPETGPLVMDTALHLARHQEKLGTAVFSSGYISRNPGGDFRPHHYDMNLVFIDQLLRHFRWTGDLALARELWPLLQRHLAWEKRNFDRDGDGLYDAYAAIWASDALQYSGGGVAHSSSYNYLANQLTAELARHLGENPTPYQDEATKIKQALDTRLWMPALGWYAEYQDALGLKQLHPAAGLWTIYHALDSEVPDPFQAYQALRYVDAEIPHIPVRAAGLPDAGYHLLSTTNWQPYDWSLNNVAMAEVLHTTLAGWQAGHSEQAFLLWKSALLESMYLGSSPGNFQQVSFYDAHRGELYRDFADPIGMAARSLVEGLFGIRPDALNNTLVVRPGFPAAWNEAALQVPDVAFDFRRQGTVDTYNITPHFARPLTLRLQVPARLAGVQRVTVNGQQVDWKNVESAVGRPVLEISSAPQPGYVVRIQWQGDAPDVAATAPGYAPGSGLTVVFPHATIVKVFDPQQVLRNTAPNGSTLMTQVQGAAGSRTAFVQLHQGDLTWWEPLPVKIVEPVAVLPDQVALQSGLVRFRVQNNRNTPLSGTVRIGRGKTAASVPVNVPALGISELITAPAPSTLTGSNAVAVAWGREQLETRVTAWQQRADQPLKTEPVNLTPYFNDRVTQIFQNHYLSPRPLGPTLQLPTQGIGNWCYPLTQANIDDAGLRRQAGEKNEFQLPWGVSLRTPSQAEEKNVLFVSQWDNYPDQATVPLKGRARHAYLLLAGSTNPMQSQLTNGEVRIAYTDGTTEILTLRNPDNWAPIEQDYLEDGFAFRTGAPRPYRLRLKTGLLTNAHEDYVNIKGYSTRAIDGGAATVLDLPLNPAKKLKSLTVKALANDVVIGLMSVTLVRE
ncbi:DUF4450 domain-containing protein [Hymenobacter sp. BT175]|uniref:DUF4450 domain-containing protein n=1 Tax=Hymenobacter translucens TaxID=2886507 RepID=UPI001D0E5F43|nr:DUF4450 domain-containing protein [Hymenobacter translucens]MCC2547479.1 DUF4450 domain-containing protein [Hymenobacter translucens]